MKISSRQSRFLKDGSSTSVHKKAKDPAVQTNRRFGSLFVLFLLALPGSPLPLSQAHAAGQAPKRALDLNPLVTITFADTPLPQAVANLFAEAGLRRAHELRIQPTTTRVRGEYTQQHLEEVLWDILHQVGGLTYQILANQKYVIEPGSLPKRPSERRKPTAVALGSYLPRPQAQRPDLVLLSGHSEEIDGLALSPNEEYLASSSQSEALTTLWLRRTNRPIRAFPGHISYPAFTADGKSLLTCQGGTLCFWDVESGERLRAPKISWPRLEQVVPSPKTPEIFLTTGYDGKDNLIGIWNAQGQGMRAIRTGREFYRASFSPDGSMIVGWTERAVRVWDLQGRPLWQFEAQNVTTAAISQDALWLAIGTDRGIVRLFSLSKQVLTQRELAHISCLDATPASIANTVAPPLSKAYVPLTLAFNPARPAVLAVNQPGGRISVFDLTTRQRLGQLDGHPSRYSNLGTRMLAFAPLGTMLVSAAHHIGTDERKLKLWTLQTNKAASLDYTSKAITYVAQGGPSSRFLLAGGQHGIWHWDLTMSQMPHRLPVNLPLVMSPDREWFAAPMSNASAASGTDVVAPALQADPSKAPSEHLGGAEEKVVQKADQLKRQQPVYGVGLWDMETGTCLRVLKPFAGTKGVCKALVFSNDDTTVVAAGWADNWIHLWDRNTGRIFLPLTGQHQSPVRQLQLSGNDLYLLSIDERDTCVLWNMTLNQVHARPQAGELYQDGQKLEGARLQAQGVEGFQPFEKFPIADQKEHPERGSVQVVLGGGPRSPYTPLATVYDHRVRLYDAQRGKTVRLWNGREFAEEVEGTAVQFTPEGHFLLVSNERETRKYLLETGELVEQLLLSGQLVARPLVKGNVLLLGRRSEDPRTAAWSAEGRTGVFATGHVGPIAALDASADGKLMVTGGKDGTIRLWDVAKRLEIATFIATEEEGQLEPLGLLKVGEMPKPRLSDYIVAQTDSYYMASKGALGKVSFRVGEATFPFEQFDLRLNRPDKILGTLNQWYNKVPIGLIRQKAEAYRARMAKFDLKPRDLQSEDLDLPKIKYIGGSPLSTTAARSLSVTVEATDARFPLAQFVVYINGNYVDLPNLSVTESKPGVAVRRTFVLPLTQSENRIEISVLNTERLESLKLLSNVRCTTPNAPSRLFVFTIGVSRYLDPTTSPEIKLCEADAITVAKVLRKLGPSQVKRGRTTVTVPGQYAEVIVAPPLLSESATKENILQKLEAFVKKTRPEDHLIFFIAGHGTIDQDTGEYYFGCHDWDVTNLPQTALSFDQLDDVLKKAPTRNKLMIMDTCHSGDVIRYEGEAADDDEESESAEVPRDSRSRGGSMVKRELKAATVALPAAPKIKKPRDWAAVVQDVFADLRRGSGAEVLSAAVGFETAQERTTLGHGVFTFTLLMALEKSAATVHAGADQRNTKGLPKPDGLLDIGELLDFTSTITGRITSGAQRPTTRRSSTEFPFLLRIGSGLPNILNKGGK